MWITIEGNIGSGKTTLFDSLAEDPLQHSWTFAKEPVDQWTTPKLSLGGRSMLDLFQESPSKRGAFFQTQALSTRLGLLEPLKDVMKRSHVVSERSPESDANIFAPLMDMNAFENECYTSIQSNLNTFVPDVVVYLKTDPEHCYQRIQKRKRLAEKDISQEYLESLHNQHEKFINGLMNEKISKRVILVLDGNLSKDQVKAQFNQMIQNYIL